MGHAVIHHEGIYFVWSTVVDAPITAAMTRDEVRAWSLVEYGRREEDSIDRAITRATKTGSSSRYGLDIEAINAYNRAGPGESHLPWPEVLALVKSERGTP